MVDSSTNSWAEEAGLFMRKNEPQCKYKVHIYLISHTPYSPN
jgi:hypothetical protein